MKLSKVQKALLSEIRTTVTADGVGLYIRDGSTFARTAKSLARKELIEIGYRAEGWTYWRPTHGEPSQ